MRKRAFTFLAGVKSICKQKTRLGGMLNQGSLRKDFMQASQEYST